MTIDLHAHSTASDGTTPPSELPRLATEAGLTVLALTDHDTFAGLPAALAASAGVEIVPGVEISCRLDDAEVHLLGLFVDPGHQPLGAELELIRTDRVRRGVRMVERCRELGAPITLAQVETIAAGAPLGRPHIAAALAAVGITDAFTSDWIADGGRADVPKHVLSTVDAIALVRAAGGVAVLAHPRSVKRRTAVSDTQLATLAEAGLSGIEADHPEQPVQVRDRLRAVAAELGLRATGSSDFHGDRKPVRLGECTTAPEVFAALRASAVSVS
ncbi:phosphoesterase [Amycolatopsis mediterranei S699]|uniref:Phosphoesterase n=2 Tax=Amycolatopsis mediterranei TaxID=33910 RepID=A0A9R0P3J5_AMYMS|nr:PHP domain-containing protein [Amycolatopsis mediterranei]ADJ48744.1 putative phosphoesterase [Amycolatopsis mediterranei U32]AEK45683.1 phosphoesterase [Amycolatopsis mediterranei S699]AFO80453.1 phosphoesterase [Amycolatopsis mediterranei S699]AGT87581.1 phosphoesterase [Amycolatopsis mediterranei RB]KDO03961.1 phosphoesterase [Amycolatopsis mediterranei]